MATAPALQLPDVESMSAEDVLRWAHEQFANEMCLTCSWQRQSSVLIHMLSGYGLELESFRPIDAPDRLWETEPDRCCHIRKVEPLERALAPYDAWITGIRREQAASRANAQKIEWSERYGVWKVQPIVDWDAKRVQAYIHVNEIPYNPLHDRGYPSIGCIPCTRAVAAGDDERSGRWSGSNKLECGIHINAPLIKESND